MKLKEKTKKLINEEKMEGAGEKKLINEEKMDGAGEKN